MNAIRYDCSLIHIRREPFERRFRQRVHLWLVDVDDLPRPAWWLSPFFRIEPADHLAEPGTTLREDLDSWLGEQGVPSTGGSVLMLASARVLGYVFDPLTVYWCLGPDGEVVRVIAEVANTYGDKHRYLLTPDEHGAARTGKCFYVSPFLAVAGRYEMRLPVPDGRLTLSVTLMDGDRRLFTSVLTGRRHGDGEAAALRAFLRRPLQPQRIRLLILMHGVALWLRRLPVVPRTSGRHEERTP